MIAGEMAEIICSRMKQMDYQGIVLPIEHVAELKDEIEECRSCRGIDAGFYEKRLTHFRWDIAANPPMARSIILTAAPQPQRRVSFTFNSQTHSVIVPPTYHADTDSQISNTLQSILSSNGYQLYPTALPLKLLAVCIGMAKYGRNNIAYVEGMGSFFRLKAFLSDIPAGEIDWLPPQVMEDCYRCKACLNECPTGAIVQERFLIHAERCLTFLNEETEDFPEWVHPAWHNSLIGCMQCQLVCPVNKHFVQRVEAGEAFDEAETRLILKEVPRDRLPPETVRKLERGYMLDYLDLLPRNLRTLLK